MDEQTQSLKHELDAALADLEEAATLGEINQTLVDMLEVLKERKAAPAPQVTVQVNPTPVTVNVHAGDCCFEHEYNAKGQITRTRMTRTPKKGA